MDRFPYYLRSVLLTAGFSFIGPVAVVLVVLVFCVASSLMPGIHGWGQHAASQVWVFLQVFGGGSAITGVIVIGLTFSFVGALFETYTFYLKN